MDDKLRKAKIFFINSTIVLAMMIVTLIILDYFNPLMGFMDRGMSRFVIILGGISLALSVILQVKCRKKDTLTV